MKSVRYALGLTLLLGGIMGIQVLFGSSSADAAVCPVRQCQDCRPGYSSNGNCRP